tara:strand:+ start:1492 stop:2478 length:987 start_codon:yes stop_codon:yes gene_type:complete
MDEGFNQLLAELESEEEEVRSSAAQALGSASDVRAIEPLIKALGDEDDDVRESIAWALGEFGGEAVEPLVKLLDKGIVTCLPKDDLLEMSWYPQDVRSSIVEALANTKDKNAVEPLIKILKDDGPFTVYNRKGKELMVCEDNWEAPASAARKLGYIGDERAIEPLAEVLRSDDRDMRVNAACSLGLMGDARGIQTLVTEFKAAQKDDESHMNRCKYLLDQIPPKDVGSGLEKLELYDDAEEWYTSASMLEKAADMRRKKADMGAAKISQKIVHGDEVTKTEIKDSVLNRSTVGGSSSKMQELKELKEMFDSGFISKDEMEDMKREIMK